MQLTLDKATQAYPHEPRLDRWVTEVAEALQSIDKQSLVKHFVDVASTTDWANVTTEHVKSIAFGYRADMSFSDDEVERLASARQAMMRRAARAIEEKTERSSHGGIHELVVSFAESVNNALKPNMQARHQVELALVQSAIAAADAIEAFDSLGPTIVDRVKADDCGSNGMRLRRCTDALRQRLAAYDKMVGKEGIPRELGIDFQEMPGNLQEQQPLIANARYESVISSETSTAHQNRLKQISGGQLEGEALWYEGLQQEQDWSHWKSKYAETLEKVSFDELQNLAATVNSIADNIKSDEAVYNVKLGDVTHLYDLVAKARSTMCMYKIMETFSKHTDKVEIRKDLRQVVKQYMVPFSIKTDDLPTMLKTALSKGLKTQEV